MTAAGDSGKSQIKKFVYKARGIALRGSIRKPFFQELGEHAAVETHAGTSGREHSHSANFSIDRFIRYAAAFSEVNTEMIGEKPARRFRTQVLSVVEGLDVLQGRITADRVVSKLTSVFDERFYAQERVPRISPAGSRFDNFRIDGELQDIELPPAFTRENDDDFFNHECGKDVISPAILAKPFHKEGLGTVYFAEWVWVHPDEMEQQALVMLRLALGSEDGMDADVAMAFSDGTGIDP